MTFENEFETLVIILGRIKEQYTAYRKILIEQRAAIITNNIAELTEILNKIEAVNENINRLEVRRTYNTDILKANTKQEVKTLLDIVKAYPEFDTEKFENIIKELKKEALEVQKLSASNAELLTISQSIVKETMTAIMTQNVDPRDRAYRTYGNNGAYSRIVRREPVHLINRKG